MRIFAAALLTLFSLSLFAQGNTTADSADDVAAPDTVSLFPNGLETVSMDSFYHRFGIDLEAAHDPELYAEIYKWYNTCYRFGGSGKKGIDCSGFVHMLYDKVYRQKIHRASYLIFEQCHHLTKSDKKREGDFVFFKIGHSRISHIGVYLQNNKFAHATTKAGVIISDLQEPYYRKYYYKAGRLR